MNYSYLHLKHLRHYTLFYLLDSLVCKRKKCVYHLRVGTSSKPSNITILILLFMCQRVLVWDYKSPRMSATLIERCELHSSVNDVIKIFFFISQTAYIIFFCSETHYEKCLKKVARFVVEQNEQVM